MTIEGNLFGDLLKIAAGEVSVATQRLNQFNTFANTIPLPTVEQTGVAAPSGDALISSADQTQHGDVNKGL